MQRLTQSLLLLSAVLATTAFAGAPRTDLKHLQRPVLPIVKEQPVKPDGQRPPSDGQRPTIEVTFVLDTTGSMGGLLDGAKQKIWSIASRIAEGKPTPRLRVGLVAYRDVGDAYVTQKYDLSEDLDQVYATLQTFQAEGGGDWPEHVGRGLADAVGKMSWSQEGSAMRMIFLVGDAPPQSYNDGYRYESGAKKAKERGIVLNTVRCGNAQDTELAWKKIAKLAEGTFISINQGGGMIAVATPYDDKLAALNSAITTKTVFGGARRRDADEKQRSVGGMGSASAADRMSFATKGGGGYAAKQEGAIDLTANPTAAATLPTEALPEAMQPMAPAARVEHASKLQAERKELETEAAKVSRERDAWLSKNAPKKQDAFDEQVMDQVRVKAASIGVEY